MTNERHDEVKVNVEEKEDNIAIANTEMEERPQSREEAYEMLKLFEANLYRGLGIPKEFLPNQLQDIPILDEIGGSHEIEEDSVLRFTPMMKHGMGVLNEKKTHPIYVETGLPHDELGDETRHERIRRIAAEWWDRADKQLEHMTLQYPGEDVQFITIDTQQAIEDSVGKDKIVLSNTYGKNYPVDTEQMLGELRALEEPLTVTLYSNREGRRKQERERKRETRREEREKARKEKLKKQRTNWYHAGSAVIDLETTSADREIFIQGEVDTNESSQ